MGHLSVNFDCTRTVRASNSKYIRDPELQSREPCIRLKFDRYCE